MKKLLSLLLALALLLGFAGCGRAKAPQTAPPAQTAAQTAPAPTAAPKPIATPALTPSPAPAPSPPPEPTPAPAPTPEPTSALAEDGSYDSKEDVALYLRLYGHLPGNYITKKQAEALGWPGGSLEPYAPGKCIGGGRFGNYEGLLPDAKGRTWTECDVDTLGAKSRGAKRLVFSNDGLIYYTEDHYASFTLLYGGDSP